MPRWQQDDVDMACAEWARQWVQHFGNDPDRASRWLGPMGSTLGRVRELHDGAGAGGVVTQRFPEVFHGQGLAVAITLHAMRDITRTVVYRHYVERCYGVRTVIEKDGTRRQFMELLRKPVKQRIIADRLGLSVQRYYQLRDVAKSCIRVGLFLESKVVDQTGYFGVSNAHA